MSGTPVENTVLLKKFQPSAALFSWASAQVTSKSSSTSVKSWKTNNSYRKFNLWSQPNLSLNISASFWQAKCSENVLVQSVLPNTVWHFWEKKTVQSQTLIARIFTWYLVFPTVNAKECSPQWNQEPRTMIAQRVLTKSWFWVPWKSISPKKKKHSSIMRSRLSQCTRLLSHEATVWSHDAKHYGKGRNLPSPWTPKLYYYQTGCYWE